MTKFNKIPLFLALIALIAALAWWASPGSKSPGVEDALSEIHDFDRAKLKGNYYLLHFWAKWCEPCADEIPHLVEFAKVGGFAKPLYVLAVSLDPTMEEAKSILPGQGKDLPPNFLLALDAAHKAAEKMGSYQYPETYFVDPSGKILEKWIGAQHWEKSEVRDYFRSKIH
jgi:thiol-disulfide isomerase/thioredoxin